MWMLQQVCTSLSLMRPLPLFLWFALCGGLSVCAVSPCHLSHPTGDYWWAASSGETKKFRCGYQALNVKTDNVDIECPLEDGLGVSSPLVPSRAPSFTCVSVLKWLQLSLLVVSAVSDWEGLEKLMDFGFRHMMRIDPSNYGLLLSEVRRS